MDGRCARGVLALMLNLVLLATGSGAGLAAPGGASDASRCKAGGWATLARADSPAVAFRNQGECVSHAVQGGTLVRHGQLGASACGLLASWDQQASLAGRDFSGCVVLNAYLYQVDLAGANLTDADLSGAMLQDADLSQATLLGAGLEFAFLEVADLSGADLSCVRLEGADLTEANLTGANLGCANLQGAIVDGATFDGAIFDEYTTCPDGSSHGDNPRCGRIDVDIRSRVI